MHRVLQWVDIFVLMCSNLIMYASLSVVHCTNQGVMWDLCVCVVYSSSESQLSDSKGFFFRLSDSKGTEAEEVLSV